MSKFQLFDGVRLREYLPLIDGGIAPIGTVGTIVEILKNGEAYLVEFWEIGSNMMSGEILSVQLRQKREHSSKQSA